MRRSRIETCTTVRWTCVLLASLCAWQAPASDSDRTCALVVENSVVLKGSPLVGLLEVGLFESGLSMVDRDTIDKAISEQVLAASLGPSAVAERMKLGHVLNADVLVLVKAEAALPGAPAVPRARLIVCDAASGIRTLVRDVPLEAKNAAAAKEWVALVVGAARVKDHARELCAVPPFVSKDLTFDHEAMKTACAAVAEQAIARRSDLCGVELAEAQALEREIRLADESEHKLTRTLPLYLLGEYRNDGFGASRVVTITLTLRQGEIECGSETIPAINPDRVGPAIVELADKLLDARRPTGSSAAKPDGIDAATEVAQLMRRAGDFEKRGDWPEAVKLYEACLLLDPNHKEARLEVIKAIAHVPKPDIMGLTPDKSLAAMAESHRLSRRGFAHTEQYCRRFAIGPRDFMLASFETANLARGDHRDPRAAEVFRETNRQNRTILLGLIESRMNQGPQDSLLQLISRQQLCLQLDGESIDEGFDRLFRVLMLIKDHPEAQKLARAFCAQHYPYVGYGPNGGYLHAPPEHWQPFVDRVKATGFEPLIAGVRQSRNQRMAADRANAASLEVAKKLEAERAAARPKQAVVDASTVRLEPLALTIPKPAKSAGSGIRGWLSISKNVDVVWSSDSFFLIGESGVAQLVWWLSESSRANPIESVVYDGQYVWAATCCNEGRLIVFDPESGKTWHVSARHGLPPMVRSVRLGSVGPGRVCVVSSLKPPNTAGEGTRGWCAIVTFDPSKEPSVNVFHEASETLPDDPTIKAAPTNVGFFPSFFGVIGPPGPDRRMVVGRRTSHGQSLVPHAFRGSVPALVIDPEKLSVDLWGSRSRLPGGAGSGWYESAAEYQHDLYFSEIGDHTKPDGWKAGLFRITGPDVEVTRIGKLPPINPKKVWANVRSAVAFDDTIYMLGDSLWAVDPKTGAATTIPFAFPDGTAATEQLGASQRYGLVTWRWEKRESSDPAPSPSVQALYRFPLPPKTR